MRTKVTGNSIETSARDLDSAFRQAYSEANKIVRGQESLRPRLVLVEASMSLYSDYMGTPPLEYRFEIQYLGKKE